MNMAIMMSQSRKIEVNDVNPHLICVLCGGYYVDATTIIECLHSFCKACIVRYLESNKYCPICDVLVHKTKPLQNIRADQTLQTMVYKLVPGLFQNEMLRRREFYSKNVEAFPLNNEDGGIVDEDTTIYTPDESFSLSLEYLNNEENVFPEEFSSRRFLRCPAAVSISHLQKLIRAKYGLAKEHRVDILYLGETLTENLTLMDIAYIYKWRRKGPLNLKYCIFESRVKRMKLEHNNVVENKPAEEMECSNPSKTFDLDIMDSIQIVLNTQELNKMESNTMKSLDLVSQDENKNKWKEVQIQISENGIMSVTDIIMEHNNNNNNNCEVPHDCDVLVVKDAHNKICCASENTYPSSVLSSSTSEKVRIELDDTSGHLKKEENHIDDQPKHTEESVASRTTQPAKGLQECDNRTRTTIPCVGPSSTGIEVSPSLSLPLSAALPLSSAVPAIQDTKTPSKVGDTSSLVLKSDGSSSSDIVTNNDRDTMKSSGESTFSVMNEPSSVKSMRPEVKVNMKRNISCRDEIKSGVSPPNNGSGLSNANVKKQSHGVSAPVGYKTLKTPPRNWNPCITHSNIHGCKSNPIPCNSEGNVFCGKGISGNGKSSVGVSLGYAAVKNSTESSVSKPARIFKTRNVPRYLGNPASGVKPMFQAVSVANTSSSKTESNSIPTTSLPKSSGLTFTKIDPKTLCPIPVGSTSTPIHSNSFVLNSPSSSNTVPIAGSAVMSISTPVSSSKNQIFPHHQNPLTKAHMSINSPSTQSNDNAASLSKSGISIGSALRNSCHPFNTSFATSMPKNAPHLLYVFSGNATRLSNPLSRTNFGPNTTIGAFHPLPPSVNMLFNPHLQHHRLQNQCVSTSSQTLITPSIQRVPASNFHQKFSVGNLNNGINNKGNGDCNSVQDSIKEECNGRESSQSISSSVACGNFILNQGTCSRNAVHNNNSIEVCKSNENVSAIPCSDTTHTISSSNSNMVFSASIDASSVSSSTKIASSASVVSTATTSNLPTPCSTASSVMTTNSSTIVSDVNYGIKTTAAFNGIVSSATPSCVSCAGTPASFTNLDASASTVVPITTKVVAPKEKCNLPVSSVGNTLGVMVGTPNCVTNVSTPVFSKATSVVVSHDGTNFVTSVAPSHSISSAVTFTTHCNTSLKTVSIPPSTSVSLASSAIVSPIPVSRTVPVTFPLLYNSTSVSVLPDNPIMSPSISNNGILLGISPISSLSRSVPSPAHPPSLKVVNSMRSPVSAIGTTSSSLFATPKTCTTCVDSYSTCATANVVNVNVSAMTSKTSVAPVSSDKTILDTSTDALATTTAAMSGVTVERLGTGAKISMKTEKTAVVTTLSDKCPIATASIAVSCSSSISSGTIKNSMSNTNRNIPVVTSTNFTSSGNCNKSNISISTVSASMNSAPPSLTGVSGINQDICEFRSTCVIDTDLTVRPNNCVTNSTSYTSTISASTIPCTSDTSIKNSFLGSPPSPSTSLSETLNPSQSSIHVNVSNKVDKSDKKGENPVCLTTSFGNASSVMSLTSPVSTSEKPQSNSTKPSGLVGKDVENNDTHVACATASTEKQKIIHESLEKCSRVENSVQCHKEETVIENESIPLEKKKESEKDSSGTVLEESDIQSLKKNEDKVGHQVGSSEQNMIGDSDSKRIQSFGSQVTSTCKDVASGVQCNNNYVEFVNSEADSCKSSALSSKELNDKTSSQDKCKDYTHFKPYTKNDDKSSTSTKVDTDSDPQTASTLEKNVNTRSKELAHSNTLSKESHNV